MSGRLFTFRHRSLELNTGRPLLAGILNCTPDSFSDGGCYDSLGEALSHAEEMLQDGAAILDIGGESTRPGFTPVAPEEECQRILPVIMELRRRHPEAILSIDTSKASVAEKALAAGADIINDISGLADPLMSDVLTRYQAGCVIMHNGFLKEPAASSLCSSLQKLLEEAMAATHLPASNFVVDPGIGFGKSDPQIWEILSHLSLLDGMAPVYLGVSRKSFIGRAAGVSSPRLRLPGTLAVTLLCRSWCSILRVHDVPEHRQALEVASHFYTSSELNTRI